MDRDDIFKLLLIILLLTNNETDCNNPCENGLLGNINQIIIIMLLLNSGNMNNTTPNNPNPFADTTNPFSTTF